MNDQNFNNSIDKLKSFIDQKNIDNNILNMFRHMTPEQLNSYKSMMKFFIDVNDPITSLSSFAPELINSLNDEELSMIEAIFIEFLNN